MPSYRIRFVNRVLSSDGHQFTAVQRILRIVADDADQATRLAQRRFEEMEHVTHWRNHAQSMQVESVEDDNQSTDPR